MALDLRSLPPEVEKFTNERHLATLTVLRPDGTPHVSPVGFSWDETAGLVRIITFAGAQKVRHLRHRPHPRAAVCQVDGGRWLTFEGPATVTADPERVAAAVERYAARYRPPSERPDRVAIEIAVDRVMGRP
ncbi:MAG TPA: PPOX class F420-dependent oxidoreductase [Acidimicrobiales bacterium]